mmetsp:Transcript_21863/g.51044  ORF Transcript_21863/g.51044 Transcript_21863/m.51044 type:complete len:480 (+) Transcript_21863:68-1507(+)
MACPSNSGQLMAAHEISFMRLGRQVPLLTTLVLTLHLRSVEALLLSPAAPISTTFPSDAALEPVDALTGPATYVFDSADDPFGKAHLETFVTKWDLHYARKAADAEEQILRQTDHQGHELKGLRGIAPSRSSEPHQQSQVGSSAKPQIFFLFMTLAGLQRPDLWEAFFEGASTSQYRALVHCRSQASCKMRQKRTGFVMVDTVPTKYCSGLTGSMIQLVRNALPLSNSPHDKFVFVSDSTLPVKPFAQIYKSLMTDDGSSFCFFPTAEWVQVFDKGGHHGVIPKHHQWAILSQEHAKVLVARWRDDMEELSVTKLVSHNWTVPACAAEEESCSVQNATRFSALLPRRIMPECTDEWTLFSVLYGVLMMRPGQTSRSLSGLTLNHSTLLTDAPHNQGSCRTMVWWRPAGGEVDDIAVAIHNDTQSNLSCYPCLPNPHPTEFLRLSEASITRLRQSNFLFARKFAPGVMTLDQFKTLVLDP